MFYRIRIIFYGIREALAEGNLKDCIHRRIFWDRLATPVEMDLTKLPPQININQDTSYNFTEVKLTDLQTNKWYIPISSRRLKAFHNLQKGWRWLVITKDSTVVGDVWCVPYQRGLAYKMHPDLKMLGIRCGEGEAYGFDMLIHPTYRGKNLAVPLHRHLQLTLKNEGYRKVYGYYWDDYLPALWMHRMLKFNELPKRLVSRYFFLIKSRYLDKTSASFQDKQNGSPRKSIEDKS